MEQKECKSQRVGRGCARLSTAVHGCARLSTAVHGCPLVLTWPSALVMAAVLPAREQVNPLSGMDEGRAHKSSPIVEGILAISVCQERDSHYSLGAWPLVDGL